MFVPFYSTTNDMRNSAPGVWVSAHLRAPLCVSLHRLYALAFTAAAGYHASTSVSVAQPVQEAEAVTYDYTYQRLAKAQDAGEKRVGRGERGRKWEGANV